MLRLTVHFRQQREFFAADIGMKADDRPECCVSEVPVLVDSELANERKVPSFAWQDATYCAVCLVIKSDFLQSAGHLS